MNKTEFKYDIEAIERNMLAWWNFEDLGFPIIRLMGVDGSIEWPGMPKDFKSRHTDPDYRFAVTNAIYDQVTYYGEAFQNLDLNIGPGSMAIYLGSEPIFHEDTVWFTSLAHDNLSELGALEYDPNNRWWQYHLNIIRRGVELCKGTPFIPSIPDILENIDILSLLRTPQKLCYDIIDTPEIVREYIKQIDDIYFDYYDTIYDIVKNKKGGSSYTAFGIVAPDKCAKIQCDFAALMSPLQFRELIVPSLQKQCEKIPYTLFHLDGPDAIRHIDALLGIEKLNAINWVPGAAEPEGGDEKWYPLYDKVFAAEKSMWISLGLGEVDWLIKMSKKLIKRYGSRGMYLHYPILDNKDAQKLFEASRNNFE